MKRTIIKIDEDLCNGCGLCIEGCHEGALQLIDGKARMISDLYCDGLGACIPECPVQAITLEEREAEPYDEVKVMERIAPKGEATVIAHLNHLIDHDQMEFVRQGIQYINDNNLKVDLTKLKPMKSKKTPKGEKAPAMAAGGQAGESQAPSAGRHSHPLHGRTHDKAHGVAHGNMQGDTHGQAHGRTHGHGHGNMRGHGQAHGHGHGNMRGHGQAHGHGHSGGCPGSKMMSFEPALDEQADGQPVADQPSALRQWPVQLHLVNPQAPYFQDADVLLAADCVAFSMGNFHSKYLKGKGLAIACPKLDSGKDIYVEKLTAMIDHANINTLTVMMMEVPCCSGILQMAKMAVQNASRKVPVKALVVGLDGQIRSEQWT